jgi:ligand-binding sensor domain-containing protein/signal transduction histidine kinase
MSRLPKNRLGRTSPALPLLACQLLLAAVAPAQTNSPAPHYLINTWGTGQGLPQNIVNALAQTWDGYLWCGTAHGLARFDGLHFKVFNAQNAPELGSGRIRQLLADRHGSLWITTAEGGLVQFKEGRFTAFIPPSRGSPSRAILGLAEDDAGNLWLNAEDGAVLLFSAGAFTVISTQWDPARRSFHHVRADAQGRLWVVSATDLSRLEDGKLVSVLHGKSLEYVFLCPSRSGGWWIQTGGRVKLWRDGHWVADIGEAVPPETRIEDCLEDRRGHVWIASLGDGLFCFCTNHPPRQITTRDGLGSDLVRALMEDAEGNLWVGTRAGGLNRLRPALFQAIGKKDGLASDLVLPVCEGPQGELWVGTDGEGLDCLKGNRIQHYGREQGLDSLYLRTLLFDRKGRLWAGTWPGGLFRLENERFVSVRDSPDQTTFVASLLEDSQGRLWLGQRTTNRLVWLDHGRGGAINLPNPGPSTDVITLAEDASGAIWIGTDGQGLFRYKYGQCRRFTRQDGLPCDTIRVLYADPEGPLWIGTLDGGLCRFKQDRFITFNTRNGLVDDVINSIVDDGLGFLWCSSFQGVFRVSKKQLNVFADGALPRIGCVAYGLSDGLPALECPGNFQPAGGRLADGRLWFPTIEGLALVNPAQVTIHSVAPPVSIEEFLVDGVPQERPGFPNARSAIRGVQSPLLIVAPGPHQYEFRYTALDFSAPERVRFRCQLQGLEKDWNEAGDQRIAHYSHLPPGDYQFRVAACNQASVWTETWATLAFRVRPHVWQTWWFRAGATLFAAASLAGMVLSAARRRYKRRLQRLEAQLSVERERARIAQDIHDGVGANLTEIAWLAEVAEKDAANPEEVRAQTRRISSAARETVESFDEIVWAVLPRNDTLNSLIEYLGRRVDELFENTSTRCWFSAPSDPPNVVVPAEVRHGFYLGCKEALHNVLKHAHATEVRIQLTYEDSTLRVSIEDNGCGFDASANNGFGNGLRNLRKRCHDLGGQFDLQSRPGQGTRVSLGIRIKPVAAS